MSLEKQISTDMKVAMRAKDKATLRGLRAIKSAILLAKTAEGGKDSLTEAEEIKLLSKLAKQRKDSIAIYEKQNRPDLAEKELEEVAIIEKYLPKQLSDEELEATLKAIIAQVGASSMKEMGKVMGLASKQLAGKADGRKIATIVRNLLK